MRPLTAKELSHENLGDIFESALSRYDTERRVEILIDTFLASHVGPGTAVLEVGAGLGFFSRRLHEMGANVLATDIGLSLLERVRRDVGCETLQADALALEQQLGAERFDVVLSSECIEHTPDPQAALRQMIRVLKPGGYLSVSTPNIVWYPAVRAATLLKARPFDGLENFSSFRSMRQAIESENAVILEERGVHLFPFQIPLHGLSRWCDRNLQMLRGIMINICVLARKNA